MLYTSPQIVKLFYWLLTLDEKNTRKKESIRAQVKGYMKRAEELKNVLKPPVEDAAPENDTDLEGEGSECHSPGAGIIPSAV